MTDNLTFSGVRLPSKPADTFWDLTCREGHICDIQQHSSGNPDGRLVTPGLCHPHIHLDKCFLLQHPKYADLQIQKGDFAEAMEMTSQAKSRFETEDLMERGRALIEESISFGVTHMRAFVEVDKTVGMKCLDAGRALKVEFENRCYIQICAFAQDPIISHLDGGKEMFELMKTAAAYQDVEVIGSTPYVEKSDEAQKNNIIWMVNLAAIHHKHLDFHLDYNLDPEKDPSIHAIIAILNFQGWPKEGVITLGHCTRLTLFTTEEWQNLREDIGNLPIHFVGLPTSDLFMMGRPHEKGSGGQRPRGTLQIPQMIQEYGFQAAIGVNNIGNAFTPQGNCDPLSVAAMGVGVYQAGTKWDSKILYECISTRARAAIGLGSRTSLDFRQGDRADFVLFGINGSHLTQSFRRRKTISDLVYDACRERTTVFSGIVVSE